MQGEVEEPDIEGPDIEAPDIDKTGVKARDLTHRRSHHIDGAGTTSNPPARPR